MNVAPCLKPEDVVEEIKEKVNIAPIEVAEMKTRDPENGSHYLISLKNDGNMNEMRNTNGKIL